MSDRTSGLARSGLLLLAMVALVGCGSTSSSVPAAGSAGAAPPASPTTAPASEAHDPSQPVRAEAASGPFELVLELDGDTFKAGQPIAGRASLRIGEGSVDLYGSGGGLLAFGFSEIDGTRQMGPAQQMDCRAYRLEAGKPIQSAITKSGGFAEDEPNALFYRSFFADPLVRLPAGRWEIAATADFGVGACGAGRTMRVPIVVTVTP